MSMPATNRSRTRMQATTSIQGKRWKRRNQTTKIEIRTLQRMNSKRRIRSRPVPVPCESARRLQVGMSRSTARVSRIWVTRVGPMLPLVVRTRADDTARMCWHCAAESWSSPFVPSAGISTSVANPRLVEVSGTIWSTAGSASRIRCAVRITAGCRNPASRPSGVPRSRSTMSPEVSIEPLGFGSGERSL